MENEEDDMGEEIYGNYPGYPLFKKGIVREFQDVSESDKLVVTESTYYPEIEQLIVMWSNDGTKTAGTLARRICQLIISKV